MTIDFNLDEHIQRSEICQFYHQKCILITGASGFLGKFLLEKLLRTCSTVDKIYILIRNKKGVDYRSRVDELKNNILFTNLQREFDEKVIGVEYDIEADNLGLSKKNLKEIQQKVNIVFHIAANVKFNQPIKTAIRSNVLGTCKLLDLCETLKDLRGVVHVSTMFANAHIFHVEENVQPVNYDFETFMSLLKVDADVLEILQPKIISPWKSTYSFSKAITESIIKERYSHLPIAIYKPGVVHAPSNDHPYCGYLDNMQDSLTAMSALISLGVLRTLQVKYGVTSHVIPADFTINAMLAMPIDVYKNRYTTPKVFNYAAPHSYDIYTFLRKFAEHTQEIGMSKPVGYPWVYFTQCKYSYDVAKYLFHYLPAFIADIPSILRGKTTENLKKYHKVHVLLTVINWFSLNRRECEIDNTMNLYDGLSHTDQLLFPFDIRKLHYDSYISMSHRGMRKYLLKDGEETIPKSQAKLKWLRIQHYTFLTLLFVFLAYLAFSWIIIPYYSMMFNRLSKRFSLV